MKCQTCGIRITVSSDFQEFLAQMQWYTHVETECMKCAGMRVRISRNNARGQSLHRTPVREYRHD